MKSNYIIQCKNCKTSVARTPNEICVNCSIKMWGYSHMELKQLNQPKISRTSIITKLVCKNCNVTVAKTPNNICVNCKMPNWGYSELQVSTNNFRQGTNTKTNKQKNEPQQKRKINIYVLFSASIIMFFFLGYLIYSIGDNKDKYIDYASNQSEVERAIALITSPNGSGTGFLVYPDILITAGHVVEGNTTFEIRFTKDSNKKFVGKLLHSALIPDRIDFDYFERDYAFIKLNKNSNEKPLKLGDSDLVMEMDEIHTIGHSQGDPLLSYTKGNINSKKYGSGVFDLFKHDVASNPGNSGGPLMNVDHEVIGVLVGGRGIQVNTRNNITIPQGENIGVKINPIKSDLSGYNFEQR